MPAGLYPGLRPGSVATATAGTCPGWPGGSSSPGWTRITSAPACGLRTSPGRSLLTFFQGTAGPDGNTVPRPGGPRDHQGASTSRSSIGCCIDCGLERAPHWGGYSMKCNQARKDLPSVARSACRAGKLLHTATVPSAVTLRRSSPSRANRSNARARHRLRGQEAGLHGGRPLARQQR
jgi:hypothetical protein